MKAKTKKIRKKKKDNFAIYNFPYYKKDQSFLRFFAGKALLAFITCFYGTFYFSEMLEVQDYAFVCALFAGLSCVVFLILLGLFGRGKVIIFWAAALLLTGKSIVEWGERFFYHILNVADGKIINADELIKTDIIADPMPMLLLLSVFFGFIFALSSHHRFNPEAVLTYFAIMIIPSFLSQHTCYTEHLGVFTAGLVSLWTVSLASSANASLAVGGMANIADLDRQYRKNSRKQPPAERIKTDSLYYNRYFSDSAVMFVSVLLIVSITASLFSKDGSLKFDAVVEKVSDSVRSIGRWGADFFEGINASPFKGFFSADGGSINISNGINPEETPQSNTPVLEVTVKSKDKLYLRGDIGYLFDGKRWKSISDINYNNIEYAVPGSSVYGGADLQVKITDVFESYTPEIEYYLACEQMPAEIDGSFFIESQKVKINYLQKLNTVIFAGTPFNYIFRDNDLFSVKGDFVALADKGKINSMETSVLYQYGDVISMIGGYDFDIQRYNEADFASLPVSYKDYLTYLAAYKLYVYDYYTSVPEDEIRTLVKLLWDDEFNTSEFTVFSNMADRAMLYRARLADYLVDYFTSGKYKYSLTDENFDGEESPLYTFLFDTKAGHCAMYASSMCLLLRYFGVPARYVTGFTIGGDNCVETSEGYKYTVLQKNLHAWVEVYYDDVGWIPYDPTPSRDGQTGGTVENVTAAAEQTTSVTTTVQTTTTTAATTTAEGTETQTSDITADPEESGGSQDGGRTADPRTVKIILITAGIILLLFVIFMSAAGGLRSLDRKQVKLMKFFKSGNSRAAVKEMLVFSLKLLEIRKIYRQKGETPEEFGYRADKALKIGNVFRDAVPFYERAEFDREPEFTEEERLLVYASVTKLLNYVLDGMKPFKRLVIRIRLFGKVK